MEIYEHSVSRGGIELRHEPVMDKGLKTGAVADDILEREREREREGFRAV